MDDVSYGLSGNNRVDRIADEEDELSREEIRDVLERSNGGGSLAAC